jgi:hypothetical protein
MDIFHTGELMIGIERTSMISVECLDQLAGPLAQPPIRNVVHFVDDHLQVFYLRDIFFDHFANVILDFFLNKHRRVDKFFLYHFHDLIFHGNLIRVE